ncbi:histidine--tRNA ligase [Dichotomicrobium thermohalophilum]|uniref:Histidine--tRNA ligase n=1 Tax=Dichotomicrobium thermohalophilum TaxID=933063 RepID=A0A397Q5N9_9HYPH|nr:histidine--tRNA ligase [Dichotomicrobium thermohalophilum]RIA56596.1 histidyl-tRNA synthetase [Dichotomicrobium thermohalophilum]
MSKKTKKALRPKARLPKGMRDVEAAELRAVAEMTEKIRAVYERYGFEPLDTPAFEYTDALGKFLPDQDRPNEGVFSFQDEDEQWLSLRYDLTAPLARYVAQNYDALPKPFRRYQLGPVWRNEKPGPGRFRQFMQFDADTVGTDNVAADAEMCMLAADAMEALGIKRGDYVIRVNSRKVLDGVMDAADIPPEKRLTVLRAIDKYDRLGIEGVRQLLGSGRKDESGDFTPGAELPERSANLLLDFMTTDIPAETEAAEGDVLVKHQVSLMEREWPGLDTPEFLEGIEKIDRIRQLVAGCGFGTDRIRFDPSVVRGLEYYTGLVFEAELTFQVEDEDGRPVRFGSVGGGGRYDGLVSRFKGAEVPATGFSIGVSRLYAALKALGKIETGAKHGPVVVLVMDHDRTADYARMTQSLRAAGIRTEMYVGTAGMKAQMKYADKRAAPCVVIQGEDERARGEVQIKDLIEGAKLSEQIEDNVSWREGRPAQFSVPEDEMIEAVQSVLARYR